MNIADLNKAHSLSATRNKLKEELDKLRDVRPASFSCHVHYQGHSAQHLAQILGFTTLTVEKVAVAMIETLRQELEQRLDEIEVELKELGIVLHEAASDEPTTYEQFGLVPSDKHGNPKPDPRVDTRYDTALPDPRRPRGTDA